jgi:hypothetical protein
VPEAQGLAATICLTSLDSRTTPQSSTCIARQVPGVASVSEESEHVYSQGALSNSMVTNLYRVDFGDQLPRRHRT